ncbi:MAG: hypothetical protein NC343_03395 [Muribaculum sp.]|nr:hypothetical protein [Muribaculaceae bacterium]MCM1080772.1 hypothetical protein [Muribaculum sp.]
MNTHLHISHAALEKDIHAAVALQTLMDRDSCVPPLLTADGSALKRVIIQAIAQTTTMMGALAVSLEQTDDESIIEVGIQGAGLHKAIGRIAEAVVLREIFARVNPDLSACYSATVETLTAGLPAAMAAGAKLRISPSAI